MFISLLIQGKNSLLSYEYCIAVTFEGENIDVAKSPHVDDVAHLCAYLYTCSSNSFLLNKH